MIIEFGIIFFENFYKLDLRVNFIIQNLVGDHGINGLCATLRIPVALIAVTHGKKIVNEILQSVVEQVDLILRKHGQNAEHQGKTQLGQGC